MIWVALVIVVGYYISVTYTMDYSLYMSFAILAVMGSVLELKNRVLIISMIILYS